MLRSGGEGCAPIGKNDIDVEPHKLGSEFSETLVASFREAILDRNRPPFDPAKLPQPLHERSGPLRLRRSSTRTKKSDGRQLAGLLALRRDGPRNGAAEKTYKRPASHAVALCGVEARYFYSTSSIGSGSPPNAFCASTAAMNGSRSPSSTSDGVGEVTPVRRSFTI